MTKKRRTFDAAFKAKLVIESLREQKTVQQIASENDIGTAMLNRWRREFLDHPERVFENAKIARENQRKEDEVAAERDEMLRTIGTLTIERDYLRRSCEKLGVDPSAHRARR